MGKQLSLFTTCFVALYMGILKYQAGEILIIFLLLIAQSPIINTKTRNFIGKQISDKHKVNDVLLYPSIRSLHHLF